MKGLEASRQFYENFGKEMIHTEFPEYEERIAVGLVGHGSECFGFDDEISKDHDYSYGFCMWLTREDEEKIGFKLTRSYDRLLKEHISVSTKESTLGTVAQGVYVIDDFYKKYTGTSGAPENNLQWLYTGEEFFAEAVNGEVFRDDLGRFSEIREKIKTGMPEDVRLKKMAAECVKAAQSGQYNYSRCISHGENGAAMLALSSFVKSASSLIFLLNNVHMPYYKWMFRAMKTLPALSDMAEPLEFLLVSDNEGNSTDAKKEIIEDIALAIAKEIASQGLTDFDGNYLEPYGFKLYTKIKDTELKNLHILIS